MSEITPVLNESEAIPGRNGQAFIEQGVTEISSLEVVDSFNDLGASIENTEALAESLSVIRSEFGIDPIAFEDPYTSACLLAAAHKLGVVESQKPTSFNEGGSNMEYIADIVMLTAGRLSAFSEWHKQVVEAGNASDTDLRKAYEKYENKQLSADLEAYIAGPEMEQLRSRLGVSTGDPLQVKVLSIVSPVNSLPALDGLMPSIDWKNSETAAADKATQEEYKAWLENNGAEFMHDVGSESDILLTWVDSFEDSEEKILCMPSAVAEKIIYPDELRSSSYTEDVHERTVSLLHHEYTHTQKMIGNGVDIGLGISLEELRAEHFSGNKNGYIKIKNFFKGMEVITGYNPRDAFERDGQSYDTERVLADIMGNIGLDGLLDCLTAIPPSYVEGEHANPYLKTIDQYNNGLSGQLESMYDRAMRTDGAEEVQKRLDLRVDWLRDMSKGMNSSMETIVAGGNPMFMASLLIENFRLRYPEDSDGFDYDLDR